MELYIRLVKKIKMYVASCAFILTLLKCSWAMRLSNVFGDNVVVQWNNPLFFGFGSPGEKVVAQILSKSEDATVDESGIWRLSLTPPNNNSFGPFNISFTSTLIVDPIVLHNVVFGDVFLCSGQSNMQFTVSSSFNSTDEIADSNNPLIRVFTAAATQASSPAFEFGPPVEWGGTQVKLPRHTSIQSTRSIVFNLLLIFLL